MGPVPGEAPTSMHVWVFQHVQGGLAMASGDTRQDPVFETVPEPRWKVRTLLDPDSKEFDVDKPAVARPSRSWAMGKTCWSGARQ